MTRPLFAVGEEVILQSAMSPECNGVYIIEGMILSGLHAYKGMIYNLSFTSYDLGIVDTKDTKLGAKVALWGESALRKKPKPAIDEDGNKMSFTGLLDFCKITSNVNQNV